MEYNDIIHTGRGAVRCGMLGRFCRIPQRTTSGVNKTISRGIDEVRRDYKLVGEVTLRKSFSNTDCHNAALATSIVIA